jgi:ubiquinone/menaquinone biosynthesis C-methylase UbiE
MVLFPLIEILGQGGHQVITNSRLMTTPTPPSGQPHLDFWNSSVAVDQYLFDTRPAFLYPPETRLLGMFRERWAEVKMLDIGVGAGRTTHYFAELAGSYTAIDFAPSMIDSCSKRFAGRWPGAEFKVGDASDLAGHADASYDLVLFSFNGIDNLAYDKRLLALAEMKRVCKPGGWVVFSSHNIYSLPSRRKLQIKAHPLRFWEELNRWRAVSKKNPPIAEVMAQPYLQYCDGHVGEASQMYIRPEFQAKDVVDAGLELMGQFANDGRLLRAEDDAKNGKTSWVYYYCRKP